jgi:GTPase
MIETRLEAEKAFLVEVYPRAVGQELALEYLNELDMLTQTGGYRVVGSMMQPLDKPKAGTLLGEGKLDELRQKKLELGVTLFIFDYELLPIQVRNLEKILEVAVMDRSTLILQIFHDNARTAAARLQVELARLQFQLPRLTRMWSHLTRERGGIGGKGAGEQELETDRRIIRAQIAHVKKQLEALDRQNQTRRKHRDEMVRVALVGYTNVGKSTLMNLLSKSTVLAENKLFATLDTTVRKVVIGQLPFLLSDTVGFIRKLPTMLIESFKTTLAEVAESDVLLHVVDVSSPGYLDQMRVVNQTLADLKVTDKPIIMVFNKIDRLAPSEIADLERTWMYRPNTPAVFLSATSKTYVDRLRNQLYLIVRQTYEQRYPGADALRLAGPESYVELEEGQIL